MDILQTIMSREEFLPPESLKQLEIKIYEKSDFKDLMKLYQNVFPGYISKELWEWKNLKNPYGNFYTILIEDKSKIIGAYSVVPKEFTIRGQIFDCILSMDTMTDINYRGKGISTYLAKLTYEYAKQKDKFFVYGFPNNNSIYMFEKKLDWWNFGKMDLFYKNLNKIDKPISAKANFSIKKVKYFDNEIDNFWNRYKYNYEIIIKKDKRYLNWRFFQHPFVKYKVFLVLNDNNDIISYFILKKYKDQKGDFIGHIVDYLIGPQNPRKKNKIFTIIDQYASEELRRHCSKITLWVSDGNLKKYLERKLNYKRRKIESFFGYRILKKDIISLTNFQNFKNWYITMSNNDVF